MKRKELSHNEIRDIIQRYKEVLSPDMKIEEILDREHELTVGRVDLIALDKDGDRVFIELTKRAIDKYTIAQLDRYKNQERWIKAHRYIVVGKRGKDENIDKLTKMGVEFYELDDRMEFLVDYFFNLGIGDALRKEIGGIQSTLRKIEFEIDRIDRMGASFEHYVKMLYYK